MNNEFAYDKVRYPAQVYPKLHPSRLAAIARLHGIPVTSPKACRLLEVGCGDGLTLLTLAMAYPDSQFVGIDLSQEAIASGNSIRQKLGLDNLRLLSVDLLEWDPGEERFDFVIAHGFYSWVPHAVRERLLLLCNKTLTASGIACISYNALPGCHMRRMLWDMLKFHSDGIKDPAQRIVNTQEFLGLLKSGLQEDSAYATTMAAEIDELSERLEPSVLFHDDLADINDPCTLDQFVRHAREHGLTFLAEANYHEMSTRNAHERVRPLLDNIASDDLVTKEQYLDFFTGRRFRQTILCRQTADPLSCADSRVIAGLQIASALQEDENGPDREGRLRFSNPSSGDFQTDNTVVQKMLRTCANQYPKSEGFLELFDREYEHAHEGDRSAAMEKAQQSITRAFSVGLLELHCDSPSFAVHASNRPLASRLARLQVESGETRVTGLRPSMVELDDNVTRRLLLALDGKRDRPALIEIVKATLAESACLGEGGKMPATDELHSHLDANLHRMAQLGLLHEDAI